MNITLIVISFIIANIYLFFGYLFAKLNSAVGFIGMYVILNLLILLWLFLDYRIQLNFESPSEDPSDDEQVAEDAEVIDEIK